MRGSMAPHSWSQSPVSPWRKDQPQLPTGTCTAPLWQPPTPPPSASEGPSSLAQPWAERPQPPVPWPGGTGRTQTSSNVRPPTPRKKNGCLKGKEAAEVFQGQLLAVGKTVLLAHIVAVTKRLEGSCRRTEAVGGETRPSIPEGGAPPPPFNRGGGVPPPLPMNHWGKGQGRQSIRTPAALLPKLLGSQHGVPGGLGGDGPARGKRLPRSLACTATMEGMSGSERPRPRGCFR